MLTCFPNWERTSNSTTHINTSYIYKIQWAIKFCELCNIHKNYIDSKSVVYFSCMSLDFRQSINFKRLPYFLLNFCVVVPYKQLNLIWLLETAITFKTTKWKSRRNYASRQNRRKLNIFVISCKLLTKPTLTKIWKDLEGAR